MPGFKALPAGYRANASWLINADDFGYLAGLMDTAGGLVFASLHAPQPSLFGRPVYISADLPAPAASAKTSSSATSNAPTPSAA